MYNVNEVVADLQNSVCVAKFKKSDGSERTMRCTLLDQYLPEQYQGKGMLLNEVEKNTISVWDLDLSAWRSFRVDSLVEFAPAHLQTAKQVLWG